MNIGNRIKQRRVELELSVDDLAKRLNKNRATIYRYESNDIENFPTTVLEPLAKALQTTPAYLMGWEESDIKIKNDTGEQLLIETYRSLPEASKIRLTKYALTLSDLNALEEPILNATLSNNTIKVSENASDKTEKNT